MERTTRLLSVSVIGAELPAYVTLPLAWDAVMVAPPDADEMLIMTVLVPAFGAFSVDTEIVLDVSLAKKLSVPDVAV